MAKTDSDHASDDAPEPVSAQDGPVPDAAFRSARRRARSGLGLSAKLLVLTVLFVMLSEVLIFVPSIANFRNTWLNDRLGDAKIAAMVLEAAPDAMIPRNLELELLNAVGANTVALRAGATRRLLALSDMPPPVDLTVDLRAYPPLTALRDTFVTLLRPQSRTLRVLTDMPDGEPDAFIEVVMDDTPLRAAMLRFSINILTLSLIISAITAALVYLSLNGLFVRPMRRITENMIAFRQKPENPEQVIAPSARGDEIGIAERELAAMQGELQSALAQKNRLAALGLAVSKINHDLRNILASAQLISDRLGGISDPTVQRIAPKLIATLDRAIHFCTSTLKYGSASERPPERRTVTLAPIVDDAASTLGLEWRAGIGFENAVPPDLTVDADPDQLVRVLLNLMRNSVEALESAGTGDPARDVITVAGERTETGARIIVSDTGPGIPDQARAHLFEAFRGSARPGGTGLGLAIAAEIVRAHGGEVRLADADQGARFEIDIPDRAAGTGGLRLRISA